MRMVAGVTGGNKSKVLTRVFYSNLQRGNGFQAGLDALFLSVLPGGELGMFLLAAVDVVSSRLGPVHGSLPAAAAAPRAGRRGGGADDVGAGRSRGVQHLEPSDRNDGEQRACLLLGVKREVAEDVLVRRTGSAGRLSGSQAPLILERYYWQESAAVPSQPCEHILVRKHEGM